MSFGEWDWPGNFVVNFSRQSYFLCLHLYSLRSWFRVYGVDKNPDVKKAGKGDFVGCEVDYSGGQMNFVKRKNDFFILAGVKIGIFI